MQDGLWCSLVASPSDHTHALWSAFIIQGLPSLHYLPGLVGVWPCDLCFPASLGYGRAHLAYSTSRDREMFSSRSAHGLANTTINLPVTCTKWPQSHLLKSPRIHRLSLAYDSSSDIQSQTCHRCSNALSMINIH